MAMTDQSAHLEIVDQQPRQLSLLPSRSLSTDSGRSNARLRDLSPERPLGWFDRVWKGLVAFNLAFGVAMVCVALVNS